MSLRDRLIRLSVGKLLGDAITEAIGREKADLMEDVGGRMGATAATLDDYGEIGTVSISPGRPEKGSVNGFVVYDEQAWIEWVREKRPSAIVETVRESDQKDLLSQVDVSDVPPGVTAADSGNPYVLVNQSPQQRANAIAAYRAGVLELPSLAEQIEGGDDE